MGVRKGGHLIACMLDVAVVHQAKAGRGAQQDAVDVTRGGREVSTTALEAVLRREAPGRAGGWWAGEMRAGEMRAGEVRAGEMRAGE